MRPPHRNRAPLTPVVATKFILKYYRGQCATIFIEQQVYSVSRLFLVEKKNQTFFSLRDNFHNVRELVVEKIIPLKLNSSCEFFNDCLIFEKRRTCITLFFFLLSERDNFLSLIQNCLWKLNNKNLLVNSFVFDPLILIIVQQRSIRGEISNR